MKIRILCLTIVLPFLLTLAILPPPVAAVSTTDVIKAMSFVSDGESGWTGLQEVANGTDCFIAVVAKQIAGSSWYGRGYYTDYDIGLRAILTVETGPSGNFWPYMVDPMYLVGTAKLIGPYTQHHFITGLLDSGETDIWIDLDNSGDVTEGDYYAHYGTSSEPNGNGEPPQLDGYPIYTNGAGNFMSYGSNIFFSMVAEPVGEYWTATPSPTVGSGLFWDRSLGLMVKFNEITAGQFLAGDPGWADDIIYLMGYVYIIKAGTTEPSGSIVRFQMGVHDESAISMWIDLNNNDTFDGEDYTAYGILYSGGIDTVYTTTLYI
jgi:hypothetical protein